MMHIRQTLIRNQLFYKILSLYASKVSRSRKTEELFQIKKGKEAKEARQLSAVYAPNLDLVMGKQLLLEKWMKFIVNRLKCCINVKFLEFGNCTVVM